MGAGEGAGEGAGAGAGAEKLAGQDMKTLVQQSLSGPGKPYSLEGKPYSPSTALPGFYSSGYPPTPPKVVRDRMEGNRDQKTICLSCKVEDYSSLDVNVDDLLF